MHSLSLEEPKLLPRVLEVVALVSAEQGQGEVGLGGGIRGG